MPTAIFRPTIIESSLRDPAPGWLENLNVCDPMFVEYGRGRMPDFPLRLETVLDIVPVDLVANALVALLPHVPDLQTIGYYTVGSGSVNPLTGAQLYDDLAPTISAGTRCSTGSGRPIPAPHWTLPDARALPRDVRRRAARSVTDQAAALPGRSLCELRERRLRLRHRQHRSACSTNSTTAIARRSISTCGRSTGAAYIQDVHIPGLRRHVLKRERRAARAVEVARSVASDAPASASLGLRRHAARARRPAIGAHDRRPLSAERPVDAAPDPVRRADARPAVRRRRRDAVETPPHVPPPRLNPALMAALERLLPAGAPIDGSARPPRAQPRTAQRRARSIASLYGGGLAARRRPRRRAGERRRGARASSRAAIAHDACLVPYGGGTNVSGALMCPEDEARTIVSMDMRRMRRVLSIDRANGCALVEAGISGAELEAALGAVGYTSGHVPDSLEFSTLGGWISTNASGMKKNRYGNIEDIVLEATLVTPSGTSRRTVRTARTVTGMQPLSLLFGSEGNLGVITKALIAIHPKPEACRYGSLVFRSFGDGVACLKALRAERRAAGEHPSGEQPRVPLRPGAEAGRARRQGAGRRRCSGAGSSACWASIPTALAACTIVMEGTRARSRGAGARAAADREALPRGLGRRRERPPRLLADVRDRAISATS